MQTILRILERAGGYRPTLYLKIENPPYMALVIEGAPGIGPRGLPALSVTHYGEMNGDLMRDPEMCFELLQTVGGNLSLDPYYWRNDYVVVERCSRSIVHGSYFVLLNRGLRRFQSVTIAIILANVAVFMTELTAGDSFAIRWAMISADIMAGRNWLTLVTALFLHAGWMHILGNMLFLWAFGPQIEDAMGRIRYLAFYLLCGLAASLTQVAFTPSSTIPNLGASGAIAGVMGAFLITYPRDRIRTVLFFGFFGRITLVPAAFLIGLWFVIQLFIQVGAVADAQSGGIAYAAHVACFICGLITARRFERSMRTANWEV